MSSTNSTVSVEMYGETWFLIPGYDAIRPFLISLVSDSDHWMFISSNGGLTAGRRNPAYALFPYYTDDKLTELAHTTGSKTIIRIDFQGKKYCWEPFSPDLPRRFSVTRNLYKNRFSNKILFEEILHDFGLTFRYQWNSSHVYGFVKQAELLNASGNPYNIELLDGIQNVMPYGVNPDLQATTSNLVDAYKRSELDKATGLGIYALSAIIVDRAEPSEALKANAVWSAGLVDPGHLLSSLQLDAFRSGAAINEEQDVKGEKGAYFVHKAMEIGPESSGSWMITANVNLSHPQVAALQASLGNPEKLRADVLADIERGTANLTKLVAEADGLQYSGDSLRDARHFNNVLFNIMRGGAFDDHYTIEKTDFTRHVAGINRTVAAVNTGFFAELPDRFNRAFLMETLRAQPDADLLRIGMEYLPLKFSRRHGDPSRPWNKFSINMLDETDGSKILDYEGNWRDIFQNWEALAHAYPGFMEAMTAKFLNASTFDGYNPYRVTKKGFDWESIEPENPWSYIGYWGDHQIIYLLKFLELQKSWNPEGFRSMAENRNFVYANVPYRIKPYEAIAADPKDTIEFDASLDHQLRAEMNTFGSDAALISAQNGRIHHVHFFEKILATVLAKLSNYIPEGGIWMNTQRPEWNDANNALVGNGVSMVTLYYLRRFLVFFRPVLDEMSDAEVPVSTELRDFASSITQALGRHAALLQGPVSDSNRKLVTDQLGIAGSEYRNRIYKNGFSGETKLISVSEIKTLFENALLHLEHAINANRRSDGLYHAYNLMSFTGNGISIAHLDEMLEGQVGVLSSGALDAEASLKVLDALRASRLYRADQHSYLLYPDKNLPGFLQKNNIPDAKVQESSLLQALLRDGNTSVVNRDVDGKFHFNGNFKNAGDLKVALESFSGTAYEALASKETPQLLAMFESVFNHKAFTGRSGTFFGYEGLGSIYWHMVSKLHVAVMEICSAAKESGASPEVQTRLSAHFDEIGEGIGVHKPPKQYGAFPVDPYSHTPKHRGAQQPGMTGQVKEDILVRWGELGLNVKNGRLHVSPALLKTAHLAADSRNVLFVDLDGSAISITQESGTFWFTCCQVPFVYKKSDMDGINVTWKDGTVSTFNTLFIDEETSRHLFERTGALKSVEVSLRAGHFR